MPALDANASLRDVTVALDGRDVIRDASLEVAPGLTLLRGPNGGGKTTVLRALAGLVPLARGSRTFAPTLLYLGHRPQLLRAVSARTNLTFFARYRGLPTSEVAAALLAWGLARDADRPVDGLSAGERRRAALARTRSEPAALVLLDEPFTELDETGVARLHDELARLLAEGRCIVLATHAHPELDGLASRVVFVADGRLA